jgi:hypothetical protein
MRLELTREAMLAVGLAIVQGAMPRRPGPPLQQIGLARGDACGL